MKIDMPDDHLVFLCGGDWGDGSATDIGKIVLQYLYGDKERITEREIALGVILVRRLADACRAN